MASNETTASFIYKRKYADRKPGELAMRFHPILQLLAKKDGFVGHDANGTFWYAVRTSNPQGVSGSFTNAQDHANVASRGGSAGKQFGALHATQYGIIHLKGPALRKATSDGAFLNLVTMESEGIFDELGDELAHQVHRDGGGSKGVRGSISGDVITLSNPDDARNFKEDMTITAADDSDGGTPRTGSTFVVAVDEDAGTVTVDDETDITSFADGDFLFRQGTLGTAGTVIEGFEAHNPLTAPVLASDSFRSVDRGVNPRKLAGVRVDDTATSIEENAGLVAVKIGQSGQKATHLDLNPIKFWEVCRRLNAKVEFQGAGGKAGYGFESFSVHTPAGTLTAVSDPDAPTNRGRVLNLSQWEIKHLGKPWIHQINDDKAGFFLRKHDGDGIEGRIIFEGNTIGWLPGSNGVFSI